MTDDINEVRERLERDLGRAALCGSQYTSCDASDLRTLLADHARLQADAARLAERQPTLRAAIDARAKE